MYMPNYFNVSDGGEGERRTYFSNFEVRAAHVEYVFRVWFGCGAWRWAVVMMVEWWGWYFGGDCGDCSEIVQRRLKFPACATPHFVLLQLQTVVQHDSHVTLATVQLPEGRTMLTFPNLSTPNWPMARVLRSQSVMYSRIQIASACAQAYSPIPVAVDVCIWYQFQHHYCRTFSLQLTSNHNTHPLSCPPTP